MKEGQGMVSQTSSKRKSSQRTKKTTQGKKPVIRKSIPLPREIPSSGTPSSETQDVEQRYRELDDSFREMCMVCASTSAFLVALTTFVIGVIAVAVFLYSDIGAETRCEFRGGAAPTIPWNEAVDTRVTSFVFLSDKTIIFGKGAGVCSVVLSLLWLGVLGYEYGISRTKEEEDKKETWMPWLLGGYLIIALVLVVMSFVTWVIMLKDIDDLGRLHSGRMQCDMPRPWVWVMVGVVCIFWCGVILTVMILSWFCKATCSDLPPPPDEEESGLESWRF